VVVREKPRGEGAAPLCASAKVHLFTTCYTGIAAVFVCRVLFSIYSAKASHAQLPAISLRSATQALRLTASTPSYPAEGKVSFSRRKKRLHAVVFLCLCT